MEENRMKTAGGPSMIQCVEVLISKRYIGKIHDSIMWTLSVYSLENQPVKRSHIPSDSEVFHFMAYDWNRTVKQLLEGQQIPYLIAGYFSLDNIFRSNSDEMAVGETPSTLMKPLYAKSDPILRQYHHHS